MDARTLVGAAAVGALVVLEVAPRRSGAVAGIPIPAYVTAGHRAALAELDARGIAATVSTAAGLVNHRLNVAGSAALNADKLRALCDALLSACRAGALVASRESYEVVPQQWLKYGLAQPGLIAATWNNLETADARELTDLGRAAQQVMAARRGLQGFYSTAEDLAYVRRLLGALSIEMDQVGYLITGKPPEKTITEGVQAASKAVLDFLADATPAAAGAVGRVLLDAAAQIAFSPIGAAAIVGLVVWKVAMR